MQGTLLQGIYTFYMEYSRTIYTEFVLEKFPRYDYEQYVTLAEFPDLNIE
jgi:hypothetical protein